MSNSLVINRYPLFASFRNAEAPLAIIIVIAFVFLIALGATLWAGMSLYCMSQGMNLDTGFGWKWADAQNIKFKCYK